MARGDSPVPADSPGSVPSTHMGWLTTPNTEALKPASGLHSYTENCKPEHLTTTKSQSSRSPFLWLLLLKMGSHCVALVVLEPTDSPASPSQVLELQECGITLKHGLIKLPKMALSFCPVSAYQIAGMTDISR